LGIVARCTAGTEQSELMRIDQRLVAAVRAIVADAGRLVAPVAPEIVVARGVERLMAIIEGDESPSERCRRENAEALPYMAALGNGRGAALKAAKRAYPGNPGAHHRVSQRFRRLLREQK
jgi:hypothetical protein